jgi:hypothetical protein
VNGIANYDLYSVSGLSGMSEGSGIVYSFMEHLNISNYKVSASGILNALISGLNNGVSYTFALRSIDEFQEESEFSNKISVMPMSKLLDAPDPVLAIGMNQSVSLQWTKISKARNYIVYWLVGESWNIVADVVDNYYLVTGLVNGTDYVFKVVAVDYNGKSGIESELVVGKPVDSAIPDEPTGLGYSVEILDDTRRLITLTWTMDFAPDFRLYNVYGSGGDFGAFGFITDVFSAYYTHVGVVGDEYSFNVTKVNTSGRESNYSDTLTVSLA